MFRNFIPILTGLVILSGCGGSSSSSSDSTGDFTLNVTDSQVDNATAVIVEFTGVTLKPADGEAIKFDFDTPKSIDLLALSGMNSQPLLDDVEIQAGKYNWIRLHVNADFDGDMDSYVTQSGGSQVELRVPSGSQSGLKINQGFTVSAGISDLSVGDEDTYTIDFDLRKSLVDPVGQPGFFLKPVLRLVQNKMTGSISGNIGNALLTDASCTDADPATDNAVYIYSGSSITVDDIGSSTEPVATSLVELDPGSGEYLYEIGYLEAGDYTITFTCEASNDFENGDGNDPDNNPDDNITFLGTANVSVSAGSATTHNF